MTSTTTTQFIIQSSSSDHSGSFDEYYSDEVSIQSSESDERYSVSDDEWVLDGIALQTHTIKMKQMTDNYITNNRKDDLLKLDLSSSEDDVDDAEFNWANYQLEYSDSGDSLADVIATKKEKKIEFEEQQEEANLEDLHSFAHIKTLIMKMRGREVIEEIEKKFKGFAVIPANLAEQYIEIIISLENGELEKQMARLQIEYCEKFFWSTTDIEHRLRAISNVSDRWEVTNNDVVWDYWRELFIELIRAYACVYVLNDLRKALVIETKRLFELKKLKLIPNSKFLEVKGAKGKSVRWNSLPRWNIDQEGNKKVVCATEKKRSDDITHGNHMIAAIKRQIQLLNNYRNFNHKLIDTLWEHWADARVALQLRNSVYS